MLLSRINRPSHSPLRVVLLFLTCAMAIVLPATIHSADRAEGVSAGPESSSTQTNQSANGERTGIPWTGEMAVSETTGQIMAREKRSGQSLTQRSETRFEGVESDRSHLPQNPASPAVSQWPPKDPSLPEGEPLSPQIPSTSFTGATLADTGNAFPPDTMGAIGPTQFLVGVRGRLRTFNKTTGLADGVLNTTTDTFFNSVRNGQSTIYPRVRYDRLSGRWFILMSNNAAPNRILLAVSDGGTITAGTVWTFFFFQQDQVTPAGDTGCQADYPTLGIDANALYVGANQLCPNFGGTTAFVIRKSSVLGAGPIVVSAFRNLTGSPGGSGIYAPQGVDNFDTGAVVGYFIGVDNTSFGTLVLHRVTSPGTTPSLSSAVFITVPATSLPLTVRHQGNTNSTNGQLDALDDRLMQGVVRNGKLWTSQNIGVDNTGVSDGAARSRNACRWYQLDQLTSPSPVIVQSGTLFTASATNTTGDRNYWMPSVMVNGQGHMALGASIAGTSEFVNAATAGRLATDTLGTLQSALSLTASSTAYNPPGDTGNTIGKRRWGDYSYTSLDPCDDMTIWTIQEFCDATNSYGVRAVKLLSPPPGTPTSANPSTIAAGQPSVNVQITGSLAGGAGFYDPGAGFTCRLSVSVTGGVVVNSVTYTSPSSITINISTLGATSGPQNVTVTNPDGQSATGNGIITIGTGGGCFYQLAPTSAFYSSRGGSGLINMTAPSGCTWSVVNPASWVTIQATTSPTGDGLIYYAVRDNFTTSPRMAVLTIGGQSFQIVQDGIPNANCNFTVMPDSQSFPAIGGTGNEKVNLSGECSWTAHSLDSWLIITSTPLGSGNGSVTFTVTQNTTGQSRRGTLIVAGHFISIKQKAN